MTRIHRKPGMPEGPPPEKAKPQQDLSMEGVLAEIRTGDDGKKIANMVKKGQLQVPQDLKVLLVSAIEFHREETFKELLKYYPQMDQELIDLSIREGLFDSLKKYASDYQLSIAEIEGLQKGAWNQLQTLFQTKGQPHLFYKERTVTILHSKDVPKWMKALSPLHYLTASGTYSTFRSTASLEMREDGVRFLRVGTKETTLESEVQKLLFVYDRLDPKQSQHVEKLGTIVDPTGLRRVVKLWQGGDASNLPPLRPQSQKDLRDRAKLMEIALRGAIELRNQGLYHLDIKRQNLFFEWDENGNIVGVLGDLGGVVFLPPWEEGPTLKELKNANQWNGEAKITYTDMYSSRMIEERVVKMATQTIIKKPLDEKRYKELQKNMEKEMIHQLALMAEELFKGYRNEPFDRMIMRMKNLNHEMTLEDALAFWSSLFS